MKNRIINGAMVIDQRNAGGSVSNNSSVNVFSCDRWLLNGSVSSKYTAQQNAGSVTPPTGFSNYLGITSSSAYTVGSGEWFGLSQKIEGFNTADLGWGTANAKTVTLSFQVYSSLTGTFGGVFTNSAISYSYPFTYTISSANTWTTVFVTVVGPTSGTWLGTNNCSIQIIFGLGAGSTLSGTAGSWSANTYVSATGATSVVGTNGATFYITGVQLEVGSSATGFEYRQYGQELALCQRYYTQINYNINNYVGSGKAFSTTDVMGISVGLPVTMRAAPTGGYTTLANFRVLNSLNNANSSLNSLSYSGTQSTTTLSIYINLASAVTAAGSASTLDTGNGATAITASAEL